MSRENSPERQKDAKVFAVIRGIAYESSDVMACFDNRTAARKCKDELIKEEKVDNLREIKETPDEWDNGFICISVVKFKVHDTVESWKSQWKQVIIHRH